MRALVLGVLRRRAQLGASLVSIALAVSCSLSPIEDLPSAVDGFNVDGLDGPLDLSPGAGGSSGTGGAPNCGVPLGYQCRGRELWHVTVGSSCPPNEVLIETCSSACIMLGEALATCSLEGFGGQGGWGGQGGSNILDGSYP